MGMAVLISIRPKWCELIASGKKTIEVRKTAPKLPVPFKCYIYESQGSYRAGNEVYNYLVEGSGRRKVIGEFICDGIERYAKFGYVGVVPRYMKASDAGYQVTEISFSSVQLTTEELEDYGTGSPLFGWHISDLVIYEEPKELSEFARRCPLDHDCGNCSWYFPGIQDYDRCEPPSCGYWESDDSMIIRPPQSWMYVEEL